MRHAELKVTSGKQTGNVITLPFGKFLIGREEDCHLRPNSDLVSRHHCVFTVDEFTVRLRDLGSTNGTLVNGDRLRGSVILESGDVVSIGKIEFEVMIRDESQDTATHMSLESDTHLTEPEPLVEAPHDSSEAIPSPLSETLMEIPSHGSSNAQPPPVGDTQFMNSVPMPMQPTLAYPPMGYPQMMPYGYPGYPGMYPQQPMYPMPGMYPPQQMMMPQMPMPAPPDAPPAVAPKDDPIPLRLPNPEETGAKDRAQTAGSAGAKTSAAKAKEEAPQKAEDIIQQYLRRRPVTGGK